MIDAIHIAATDESICKNGIVTWPTGHDIDPYFLESEGSLITKTA